eukprot:CAMPEP_0196146332 /NCGR_PEP_ID=MMETSP0910-20130528/22768_1 /TAXON_ID=49265 /ORGANISM="Thalassiosira rotula, Strain GSO102" /LENGTH=366 /DNA_ID=CAMNT_0041408503 /DNA_START=17 /DNA_END=1114 /DNA_ORIENTATION=-
MPSPRALFVLAATCASFFSLVQAFLPPTRITHNYNIISNDHATSTSLFMGKRKKPSMKERRKQRSKRQPSIKVDRTIMDDLPPPPPVEETQPSATEASAPDDQNEDADVDEAKETAAKASSLVESQRKSVDSLSFVRKRVEEVFPFADAAKAIVEQGYFVHDNFLSSGEDETFGDALISEMFQEGPDMILNDKLERDITRLGDGEFVGKIVGGEKYADCPRLTEYVVSLTRHFPPMLNKELDALAAEDVSRLDATASMGTIRLYDRKTRLGAEALLMKPEGGEPERSFGVICGDSEGTENDTRRLTAMFFVSSKDWDASTCGGGVAVEEGTKFDAVRDRIILLRSDTCSHRQEPWIGEDKDGLEQA